MKKFSLLALIVILAIGATACHKTAKHRGVFLMWYYPQHAIYKSVDGKSWTKLADSQDLWATSITSSDDGTLFAAKPGKSPTVKMSKDGEHWNDVPVDLSNAQGDYRTFSICAGRKHTLYALSSAGDFQVSKDGGSTWVEQTRPVPLGARGAGDGFKGFCTVSPLGTQVLIQGWYFDPAGPVLAVTTDEGKTWQKLKSPADKEDSRGVGFLGDGGLFFAGADSIFISSDSGTTWRRSSKLLSKESQMPFYSYRNFTSDGGKTIIGVEAASDNKDPNNKWPGAAFISNDGGSTFESLNLPWATDPTPSASDEYLSISFAPMGNF